MLETRRCSFSEAKKAISELGGYICGDPDPTFADESFFILRDGRIVGVLPVFFINDVACSYDETSIIPYCHNDPLAEDVHEAICKWAEGVLNERAVRSVKILTEDSLLAAFSERSGLVVTDNTRLYGYFDLRRDETSLWASIRKRYKSKINSGERALATTFYVDKNAVNGEVLEFLINSPHTSYNYDAARVNAHLEKMVNGNARLFAYCFDKKIIGAVGIAPWQKFAAAGDHFYELGAYDHSCPIPTHFCLYDALRHYQRQLLGNKVFLLHGVPMNRPEDQKKLAGIDHFKLGYCSDTFTRPYKVITLV